MQLKRDLTLETVALGKIQKGGITLKVDKCDLLKQEVTFLGNVISPSCITPDPKKDRRHKKNMEDPTNMSDLRSFLGLVS